jgi:hypothetical protein
MSVRIEINRLRRACEGKSFSAGGYNLDVIKGACRLLGIDENGLRADIAGRLCQVLLRYVDRAGAYIVIDKDGVIKDDNGSVLNRGAGVAAAAPPPVAPVAPRIYRLAPALREEQLRERLHRERDAVERARRERQQAERERAEREREEVERARRARQQAEREREEVERARRARQQAERERVERERLENERYEKRMRQDLERRLAEEKIRKEVNLDELIDGMRKKFMSGKPGERQQLITDDDLAKFFTKQNIYTPEMEHWRLYGFGDIEVVRKYGKFLNADVGSEALPFEDYAVFYEDTKQTSAQYLADPAKSFESPIGRLYWDHLSQYAGRSFFQKADLIGIYVSDDVEQSYMTYITLYKIYRISENYYFSFVDIATYLINYIAQCHNAVYSGELTGRAPISKAFFNGLKVRGIAPYGRDYIQSRRVVDFFNVFRFIHSDDMRGWDINIDTTKVYKEMMMETGQHGCYLQYMYVAYILKPVDCKLFLDIAKLLVDSHNRERRDRRELVYFFVTHFFNRFKVDLTRGDAHLIDGRDSFFIVFAKFLMILFHMKDSVLKGFEGVGAGGQSYLYVSKPFGPGHAGNFTREGVDEYMLGLDVHVGGRDDKVKAAYLALVKAQGDIATAENLDGLVSWMVKKGKSLGFDSFKLEKEEGGLVKFKGPAPTDPRRIDFIRAMIGLGLTYKKDGVPKFSNFGKGHYHSFLSPEGAAWTIVSQPIDSMDVLARLYKFSEDYAGGREKDIILDGILTSLAESVIPGTTNDLICNGGKLQKLFIASLQGRLKGVKIDEGVGYQQQQQDGEGAQLVRNPEIIEKMFESFEHDEEDYNDNNLYWRKVLEFIMAVKGGRVAGVSAKLKGVDIPTSLVHYRVNNNGFNDFQEEGTDPEKLDIPLDFVNPSLDEEYDTFVKQFKALERGRRQKQKQQKQQKQQKH